MPAAGCQPLAFTVYHTWLTATLSAAVPCAFKVPVVTTWPFTGLVMASVGWVISRKLAVSTKFDTIVKVRVWAVEGGSKLLVQLLKTQPVWGCALMKYLVPTTRLWPLVLRLTVPAPNTFVVTVSGQAS